VVRVVIQVNMSTVNQCSLAAVHDVDLGDVSHVTVCPALRFRILSAVSLKSQVFQLGYSNQIKTLLEMLDSEHEIITML